MFFLTETYTDFLFLLQDMKALTMVVVQLQQNFPIADKRKNNTSHFSLHQQKWFEDLFEHLTRCFWPSLTFNIGIVMIRGL